MLQLFRNYFHFQVMGDKDKDLALTFTLKDKDGRTFTNVDSLKIETQVSDDSILSLETAHPTIPEVELSKFAKINAKRKTYVFLHLGKAKNLRDCPTENLIKL